MRGGDRVPVRPGAGQAGGAAGSRALPADAGPVADAPADPVADAPSNTVADAPSDPLGEALSGPPADPGTEARQGGPDPTESGRDPARTARADVLLLVAAVIWGFAFVAQRAGMAHVGPFLFNAIRFALGAAVLTPFIHHLAARRTGQLRAAGPTTRAREAGAAIVRSHALGGLLAGIALFGGISLQQTGLVHTSAGKAGFITGLYVVIVPLMALFWGQRASAWQWLGAALAVAGLYLLSVTGRMSIARGDLLVLGGAVFWAIHVHLIAWLTRSLEPVRLAGVQFWVCAGLSLLVAALFEPIELAGIVSAAVPILYAGLLSVGVAYTFQVIGQRDAHPAHAAILLSLEAVFAVVGGFALLGETLTPRAAVGCGLMLGAMLVAQLGAGQGRARAAARDSGGRGCN